MTNLAAVVLVRFDCGCVGTPPLGGHTLLIDACDSDHDSDKAAWVSLREIDKPFVPVDAERQKRLLDAIHAQLADGLRYRAATDVIRDLMTGAR